MLLVERLLGLTWLLKVLYFIFEKESGMNVFVFIATIVNPSSLNLQTGDLSEQLLT